MSSAREQGRVVVVGSVNADHVFGCEHLPTAGETVLARTAAVEGGGKGANQAAAAATWGAPTTLVAAVGDDDDGRRALADLRRLGVDTGRVAVDRQHPTGRAIIVVDRHGENSIVVARGANGALRAADVERTLDDLALRPGDVVLSSGEVSEDVVVAAAAAAARSGVLHVHNLAPVSAFGRLADLTGVLVVNEVELAQLSGEDELGPGAARLCEGRCAVVVTLGARGAALVSAAATVMVPAVPAVVVDTTGAGDALCGVLAAELAVGAPLADAVAAGVRAGSRAVTAAGARGALATREQHAP